MNEPQLRSQALAALEKLETARTGRVRMEVLARRAADDPQAPGLYPMNVSDMSFDREHGSSAIISESSDGTGSGFTTEMRAFLPEDTVYSRTFMTSAVIEELSLGSNREEGAPEDAENAEDAKAALWSVFSLEQFGQNVQDLTKPPDQDWLKARLADPASLVDSIETSNEQTSFALHLRKDQLPVALATLTAKYRDSEPIGLRLTLRGEDMTSLSLNLPSSSEDLAVAEIRYNYWRMGLPVKIEAPAPQERLPRSLPIHTAIESLHLGSSDRYLSFDWGGAKRIDDVVWTDTFEDEKPYVPLAAGDQVRIWGSTRPLYRNKQEFWAQRRAKSNCHLIAVFSLDGRKIVDHRLPEEAEVSTWRRRHYERTTDITDQIVTLAAVRSESEYVEVRLKDEIAGLSEGDFSIPRENVIASGLAKGTPVVVYPYPTSGMVFISRVELEDGTVVYDAAAEMNKRSEQS